MFTTGFIILLSIVAVVIIGLLSVDEGGPTLAAIIFIVAMTIGHFFFDSPVVGWVETNPMVLLYLFLGYLAIGAAYSIFRWLMRVRKTAVGLKKIADNFSDKEEDYKFEQRKFNDFARNLLVSENKERIMGWIGFWPFDMVLWLVEEPLQRIYDYLTTTYQRIAKSAVRRVGLETEDVFKKG